MSAAIRRHGMALIAGGALLGIAAPGLALALRPWLLLISLAVMALALLRVDPAALAGVVRRPRHALLLLAWVTLGVPALVRLLLAPLGEPGASDLTLIVAAAQLGLFVTPALVAPAYRRVRRAGEERSPGRRPAGPGEPAPGAAA